MTDQIGIFFRKTVTASKNLKIVAFFMLVFLASCNNTSESNKIKSKNSSEGTHNGLLGIQEKFEGDKGPNGVYTYPEKYPQFIGGIKKFGEFLNKNLVYPEWEKTQKIEGRVFVTFIVEKDGSTSSFQVARVPNGSKNLGNEAVRVLRLMPKWIPGEIEGKKVRVSYTVPIFFELP